MRKSMKISDVIKTLSKLYAEHGDLDIVYAIDDEGNAFHKVYHSPSVGIYNRGDFLSETEYEELKEQNELWYPDDSEKVICIN
jgi:hypothetical protein